MIVGTMVRNVSCVDVNGVRLWANVVLIDDKKGAADTGLDRVRQIRGFGQNGRSVFTIWIDSECEAGIEQAGGGNMVMFGSVVDGKNVNLDRGAVIRATAPNGDPVVVSVICEEPRSPVVAERFEVERFDDEFFDDAILKTWGAPGYTISLAVAKRDLPRIRDQLREWGSPL